MALALSWEKRMECVSRYMLLGNMRVVSEQTGVGYDTLIEWKKSDWWPDLVEQLRRQKKAKTSDSITKIVEQSLDIMQDRLENGDPFFNQKTGKVEYKPVSVKDATTIASSLLQRQLQLEELAQKHEVQADTVQETLSLLAKEFKKWNKSSSTEVIEDAVYAQREAGLQEGGGSVHQQALSNQETSRAE